MKSAKLEMPYVSENLTGVFDHEGCKNHYRGWTDLRVPPEELRPAATLTTGQCFNWRLAAPDCWVGVLGSEVVAIRCARLKYLLVCIGDVTIILLIL